LQHEVLFKISFHSLLFYQFFCGCISSKDGILFVGGRKNLLLLRSRQLMLT